MKDAYVTSLLRTGTRLACGQSMCKYVRHIVSDIPGATFSNTFNEGHVFHDDAMSKAALHSIPTVRVTSNFAAVGCR